MNQKRKRMILLIDDDEIQNFITQRMIQRVKENVQLEVCTNGQMGLDALYVKGLEPELILLDINMPVKNGWDFIDEYMKHEHPKMPIYILTSSIHDGDRKKAAKYDCVKDFLVKPLSAHVIEDLLLRHGITS